MFYNYKCVNKSVEDAENKCQDIKYNLNKKILWFIVIKIAMIAIKTKCKFYLINGNKPLINITEIVIKEQL